MGKLRSGIRRTFDFLDALEMLFYALGGAGLLGVAIYFGVKAAHERGGPALVTGVLALLTWVVVLVVRDVRRKKWSPVSISVASAWLISVLALIIGEWFI